MRILEEASPTALIVLAPIMALFFGAILGEIGKSKLKLPVMPSLLVVAILIGSFWDTAGILGDSGKMLAGIKSEGILLILVPILVLEAAFTADFHIFKRSIYQILLLAGPGLIIQFFFYGIILKLILGYGDEDIEWYPALALGSLLSATDPGAAVKAISALGAPNYLRMIMSTESLFNISICLIFFSTFVNVATGVDVTIGDGIADFFILLLGGIAVGLAGGIILSLWHQKIGRDSTQAITITLGMAYLVVYVCENIPERFSSLFCIITLGLYLSANGRTKVSKIVTPSLHAVLGWCQYAGGIIIFFLAGVMIGVQFFSVDQKITGADWGKMIAFYFLGRISRVLMIYILSCLFNKGNYRLSCKELFVVGFGGLRGSIGISLAVAFRRNELFALTGEKSRAGDLVLFFASGHVFFNYLIDASLMPYIIRKLGIVKRNPARDGIFKAIIKDINKKAEKNLKTLKKAYPNYICDWQHLNEMMSIGDDEKMTNLIFQIREKVKLSKIDEVATEEQMVQEARHRSLKLVISLVWERFHAGLVQPNAVTLLDKAVRFSHDDLSRQACLFDFCYKSFIREKTLAFYGKLARCPLLGRVFKHIIVDHLVFVYDVMRALLTCLDGLQYRTSHFPVSQEAINRVLNEFAETREDVKYYLFRLENQFPAIVKAINTRKMALKLLSMKEKDITDRNTIGELEDVEYSILIQLLDKKRSQLMDMRNVRFNNTQYDGLLGAFSIFDSLNSKEISKIKEGCEDRKFKKGETLFECNAESEWIYMVVQGQVEMKIGDQSYKRGPGHTVSFMSVVSNAKKFPFSLSAISDVKVKALKVSKVLSVVNANKKFEHAVMGAAMMYMRFLNFEASGPLAGLSETDMALLVQESEICEIEKGKEFQVKCGGFLVNGEVQYRDNEKYKISNFSMLPVTAEIPYKVTENAKIVRFWHSRISDKSKIIKVLPHADVFFGLRKPSKDIVLNMMSLSDSSKRDEYHAKRSLFSLNDVDGQKNEEDNEDGGKIEEIKKIRTSDVNPNNIKQM